MLPHQRLPPDAASEDDNSIDEALRLLAEQYPPSTPLDEL
jgi:hypothetical protein